MPGIRRTGRPYKSRKPLSREEAFLKGCLQLGLEDAAAVLERSEAVIRGLADPDKDDRQINLRDAEKIDAALIAEDCEPTNFLAYQARIEALRAGQDTPTLTKHIEWATAQLEQAEAALERNGLSDDEYRRARKLITAIIGRASRIAETIDDHEEARERRVPRAVS